MSMVITVEGGQVKKNLSWRARCFFGGQGHDRQFSPTQHAAEEIHPKPGDRAELGQRPFAANDSAGSRLLSHTVQHSNFSAQRLAHE